MFVVIPTWIFFVFRSIKILIFFYRQVHFLYIFFFLPFLVPCSSPIFNLFQAIIIVPYHTVSILLTKYLCFCFHLIHTHRHAHAESLFLSLFLILLSTDSDSPFSLISFLYLQCFIKFSFQQPSAF